MVFDKDMSLMYLLVSRNTSARGSSNGFHPGWDRLLDSLVKGWQGGPARNTSSISSWSTQSNKSVSRSVWHFSQGPITKPGIWHLSALSLKAPGLKQQKMKNERSLKRACIVQEWNSGNSTKESCPELVDGNHACAADSIHQFFGQRRTCSDAGLSCTRECITSPQWDGQIPGLHMEETIFSSFCRFRFQWLTACQSINDYLAWDRRVHQKNSGFEFWVFWLLS